MTDEPTPTTDLLKRCAEIHEWRSTGLLSGEALRDYAKRKWSGHLDTLQMAEHETVTEALALLAKWGQPAQAAEPVVVVVPCHTPSGKRVALYSAKQDLPIGTKLYAAPQPSPTTQAAESVPAIQGEMNVQLDTDSNPTAPGQQRDMACPLALGQPVGNGQDQAAGHLGAQGDKLLTVAERNIRSFLRSATFKSESDREAALNCVDVLWEAARASADSVTAAAGDPLDWPLPCDITAGSVTIGKGCPLRTVQTRLKVQAETNLILLRRMGRGGGIRNPTRPGGRERA